MDLCDRDYGFLHLPSCFVFLNPWSADPTVTDFIQRHLWQPDRVARAARLREPSLTEVVNRVGSLVHERKHFHDLLLTPYGNRLVRTSFEYALSLFWVFDALPWARGQRIDLPLQSGDVPAASREFEEVLAQREQLRTLLKSGHMVLEATAALTQRQFTWTCFGSRAHALVELDLARHPVYSAILRAFEVIGYGLGNPTEWGLIVHLLLLAVLGRGVPSAGHRSHTSQCIDLLDKLSKRTPFILSTLVPVIEAAWKGAESNMEVEDEANQALLRRLRQAESHRA